MKNKIPSKQDNSISKNENLDRSFLETQKLSLDNEKLKLEIDELKSRTNKKTKNLRVIISVLIIVPLFGFYFIEIIMPFYQAENIKLYRENEKTKQENEAFKKQLDSTANQLSEYASLIDQADNQFDKEREILKEERNKLIDDYQKIISEKVREDSLNKIKLADLERIISKQTIQKISIDSIKIAYSNLGKEILNKEKKITELNTRLNEIKTEKNRTIEGESPKLWYVRAYISNNILLLEFQKFAGTKQIYASYDPSTRYITCELWTIYYKRIEERLNRNYSHLFEKVYWDNKQFSATKRSVLKLKVKKEIILRKKATPETSISTEKTVFKFPKQR